jgi:hypothetical protein
MSVNRIVTRDYEKKSHWTLGENKAKQSQFTPDQNEASFSAKKGRNGGGNILHP